MDFIEITDAKLAVAQAGSGQPLLLVHGFPLDHSMWRHQLDGLSDDFRVIAPDLRGFGNSTGATATMTMEQLADDLAELVAALHINEPITFCGLSMGGYIGWQFWKRHSSLLDRLILCDTRAIADSAEVARGRSVMAEQVLADGNAKLAESMLPKLFSAKTVDANPEIVEATRQVVLNCAPKAVAGSLRGMAERVDMSSELADVKTTTLVVCGQDDVISPVDEMRGIADALPDATFFEVPDAGHMSPLENSDFVNSIIRDFVNGTK